MWYATTDLECRTMFLGFSNTPNTRSNNVDDDIVKVMIY